MSAPQLTEPDNLPPAPFTRAGLVLADATLRQTARVTIGGDRLRLRFSNAFGGAVLPITAVTVARPVGGRAGVAAIEPGSARPVTFHGRASVVVPVGAQVVSDPLDFPVGPEANLTVTAHLADGQASDLVTSHPGSRTTSHLAAGDHVDADDLTGATTTDHWYFLSGIEVWSRRAGSAVVTLGDSLTDGRGSTTNGNDRWPDRLSARLRAHPATADVAVLNQGTGGNRVLSDGIGPSALARFDRDVLAQSGVAWLVLFEGINDLCTAHATAAAQEQVVNDLCAAYEQIVVRAHAHGIAVYGATLTPLGGNEAYDDPDGHRDAARQAVNEWIRAAGVLDAVLDFDAAVRDPHDPRRLLAAYDEGDHLHLTPAGYRALADAVPLELFAPSR
ncbi:SGNH/GDSL hydrolase family protein [Saccharothrix sp. S26]|uniref:SGNH/GDSL hydrolase family protein n=1 Tax=Saccharothrix sp. S26 TaxID=2907215 RepID=UPI001F2A1EF3|nr:SGNH/GDSL hydrolase family protein [Saccharothrix sp. S26]MCE7000256.1 SGNH/GDSL hydrolase family protein [Saccharothrix sp. S26]